MHEIALLQRRLSDAAQPQTKHWWEAYLKGVIPFRGVPMSEIRAAVHAWVTHDLAPTALEHEGGVDLALVLLHETFAEDKLAGILLLQEVLLPRGLVLWQRDLPRFGAAFEDGAIADWSTCDWFCVRVLGPMVVRDGRACAEAIAAWRHARSLWQRRAAGVAFVNLAPRGDANFAGFTDMVLEVCATTVQSPERFAQTGTGWVLRELSRAEPDRVEHFVVEHLALLSREGLRYATAKLPKQTQIRLAEEQRARR